MADDENRMFDPIATPLNIVLVDGDSYLPQIFNHLLVQPHYEFDWIRALHRCFAIRLLNIHDFIFISPG